MKRLSFAIAFALLCVRVYAQEGTVNDGMPFGPVGDADLDRLQTFAKASGLDLKAEMARVYCCDKSIDKDALARAFKFSLSFKTLDANARAYGQIIYSSLLRVGEVLGVDYYVRVLDRQPPEVQQRIRDFLYYPNLRIPKEHRKEAEEETNRAYPSLFPKGFQFGRNDPIFAKET